MSSRLNPSQISTTPSPSHTYKQDSDQLANYIQNTVKCEDDCDVGEVQDENPTPATTCTSATPGCCGYRIAEDCDNTAMCVMKRRKVSSPSSYLGRPTHVSPLSHDIAR